MGNYNPYYNGYGPPSEPPAAPRPPPVCVVNNFWGPTMIAPPQPPAINGPRYYQPINAGSWNQYQNNMQPAVGYANHMPPAIEYANNMQPAIGYANNMQAAHQYHNNVQPAAGNVNSMIPYHGGVSATTATFGHPQNGSQLIDGHHQQAQSYSTTSDAIHQSTFPTTSTDPDPALASEDGADGTQTLQRDRLPLSVALTDESDDGRKVSCTLLLTLGSELRVPFTISFSNAHASFRAAIIANAQDFITTVTESMLGTLRASNALRDNNLAADILEGLEGRLRDLIDSHGGNPERVDVDDEEDKAVVTYPRDTVANMLRSLSLEPHAQPEVTEPEQGQEHDSQTSGTTVRDPVEGETGHASFSPFNLPTTPSMQMSGQDGSDNVSSTSSENQHKPLGSFQKKIFKVNKKKPVMEAQKSMKRKSSKSTLASSSDLHDNDKRAAKDDASMLNQKARHTFEQRKVHRPTASQIPENSEEVNVDNDDDLEAHVPLDADREDSGSPSRSRRVSRGTRTPRFVVEAFVELIGTLKKRYAQASGAATSRSSGQKLTEIFRIAQIKNGLNGLNEYILEQTRNPTDGSSNREFRPVSTEKALDLVAKDLGKDIQDSFDSFVEAGDEDQFYRMMCISEVTALIDDIKTCNEKLLESYQNNTTPEERDAYDSKQGARTRKQLQFFADKDEKSS